MDPLISTPIAIIASKGFLGTSVVLDFRRSVVDEESRSVALMPSPAEELAWTWDAA